MGFINQLWSKDMRVSKTGDPPVSMVVSKLSHGRMTWTVWSITHLRVPPIKAKKLGNKHQEIGFAWASNSLFSGLFVFPRGSSLLGAYPRMMSQDPSCSFCWSPISPLLKLGFYENSMTRIQYNMCSDWPI